jgi:phenylalanyl-tRNA synthetase beta chain
VESVFRHVQLTPSFVPTNVPGMADGQAAEYHIEGHRMAVVGMTSPAAKAALDLRTDVALAEINFTQIQNLAHLETRVTPLPDQPAIVRDLAVVFGESIAWAQIESLVRSSAGAHLEELEFVDLYRGKPVDAGHKSIAFRMTFRAPDRTLTRLEVDSVVGQIVEQLGIELGGKLRA